MRDSVYLQEQKTSKKLSLRNDPDKNKMKKKSKCKC